MSNVKKETRDMENVKGAATPALSCDPSDTVHFVVKVIFVAAALGIGLFRLGEPSLWFDEAYSWYNISGDWKHYAQEVTHGEDCGGFVNSLLLKLWTGAVGTSEFAMRLPSVFYFAGLVLVLIEIGRELGSVRAGCCAAFLALVHPEVVVWARQVRAYSLEMLLTALFLLLLIRYSRAYDRRRGAVLAFAASLLSVVHVFGVFVVAGGGLFLLLKQLVRGAEGTRAWKLWAVWPTLVPLPLLAGWTFVLRSRINNNLNSFWIRESVFDSYRDLARSMSLPLLCAGICLLVATVRIAKRRASAQERLMFGVCTCLALTIAAGPLVVSVLSRGGHHFILARYHYPLLIVLFTSVGYYAAHLPRSAMVLGLAGVAVFMFEDRGLARTFDGLAYDDSDTRAAAAHLAAERRPDDVVLIAPWDERITAMYYGISGPTTRTAGDYDAAPEIPAAVRADAPPRPGGRKWVLLYRRNRDDDLATFGLRGAPCKTFGTLWLARVDGAPSVASRADVAGE